MYHKKFAEWREMGTFPRKKRRHSDFTGDNHEHRRMFPHTLRPCDAVSDGFLMTERERSVSLGESDLVHSIAVSSDLFCQQAQYPEQQVDDATIQFLTPAGTDQDTLSPHQVHNNIDYDRQHHFYSLLNQLWDTYFDSEFGSATEVEVGQAMGRMVSFIIDLMATDCNISNLVVRRGDLDLIGNAFTWICAKYPRNEGEAQLPRLIGIRALRAEDEELLRKCLPSRRFRQPDYYSYPCLVFCVSN